MTICCTGCWTATGRWSKCIFIWQPHFWSPHSYALWWKRVLSNDISYILSNSPNIENCSPWEKACALQRFCMGNIYISRSGTLFLNNRSFLHWHDIIILFYTYFHGMHFQMDNIRLVLRKRYLLRALGSLKKGSNHEISKITQDEI